MSAMPAEPFIPFARPGFVDEDAEAAAEVIRSGWWTTGPQAHAFEEEFAAYVGAPHAIAVNSCTAALHLALAACGVGAGEGVIVPAMTFAATAEVATYSGSVPLLADVEEDTSNIDVAQLRVLLQALGADKPEAALAEAVSVGALAPGSARAIGSGCSRAAAVIPVHYAGQACRMGELLPLASEHGLRVIEDAAHAVETTCGDRKVGTMGDASAFSFYATKNVSTGEGGMITTNDPRLAERMRRLSLHGISHDAWNRYTDKGSWYYEIVEPGFKYNMTDIAAVLGRRQLARIDEMAERRREIAATYTGRFERLAEVAPPRHVTDGVHAWHLYVLRLVLERLAIDRAAFIEELRAAGIGASVHFIPLHLHPYYRERFGFTRGDFPVAERLYDTIVSLPLYPRLTDGEVERVCAAVEDICRRHAR